MWRLGISWATGCQPDPMGIFSRADIHRHLGTTAKRYIGNANRHSQPYPAGDCNAVPHGHPASSY